jgi:hypothetical protein
MPNTSHPIKKAAIAAISPPSKVLVCMMLSLVVKGLISEI